MRSSASFAPRHNRTIPLALVGGLLSVYALYVEHMTKVHAHDVNEATGALEPFTALCDIEQIGASCRYVTILGFLLCATTYL